MNRWEHVEALFAEAADRPPAEQAALLAACPDEDVRREVASLLEHHTTGGAPLESAVGGVIGLWAATETSAHHATVVGRRIGAYEVTGIVGQGGMGAVYRARRADGAFEQDVAIKVVRHGFETPQALDRFRQERQILARLTHPAIARLLDGGTTRDERGIEIPYLVLEYVDGASITAYAHEHALPISARLTLFRRVCDAVLHAHQQLIVHRDLKPGNILVTTDGEPKLLDFGIAKLIAEGAEQGPALTAEGATLSTPEYASPEQVRGEPITVATDVYALGAVLYELLTGIKAHRFETRSPVEIGRVVCETAVTRPSVAVRRDASDQVKLARQLAGDLDTIVLKALHKDPTRRYASVEQLSEDLRRYLDELPVMARPDTALYRTTKFVRRNALLVGVMVLALASLITGLAISMQQTRRADRRFQQVRTLANRLLTDIEPRIRDVPGTAAAQQAVAATATEYLDSLRADAEDDPDLLLEVADGYIRIANVEGSIDVQNFGRYESAIASYDKALAIVTRLEASGRFTPRAAAVLATVHLRRGELSSINSQRREALRRYQQATEAAERGLRLVSNDRRLIGIAFSADNRYGDLLLEIGDVMQATAAFERGLTRARGLPGIGSLTTTTARLAGARRESGQPAAALALFRECLEEVAAQLRESPQSSSARHTGALLHADIGVTLVDADGPNLGETAEGLAAFREALIWADTLGRDTAYGPHAARALVEVGIGHAAVQAETDPRAAVGSITAVLDRLTALRGMADADDLRLLDGRARTVLAHALARTGRFAEGRPMADAAVAELQALRNRDPDNVTIGDALVRAHGHLGEIHAGLGDPRRAEEELRRALSLAGNLVTARPERPRGRALQALGRQRLAALLSSRSQTEDEPRQLLAASRAEWESWLARGWAEPYARAQLRLLPAR